MQLPDNRWSFVTSVSGFYVGNIFESDKKLKKLLQFNYSVPSSCTKMNGLIIAVSMVINFHRAFS